MFWHFCSDMPFAQQAPDVLIISRRRRCAVISTSCARCINFPLLSKNSLAMRAGLLTAPWKKMCVRICEQRVLRLVYERLQSVLRLHFLAACRFLLVRTWYVRAANAHIRLHGCASWSEPLLVAYARRHILPWHASYYDWCVIAFLLFVVTVW